MPRILKLLIAVAAGAGLTACTVVPPRVDYVGPRIDIYGPVPYYAPAPYYYAPAPYYYRGRRW